MKQRITALILSVVLVFGILPISALTVFAEDTAPVAAIGETEYATLAEAFAAAQANDTILLLKDTDLAGWTSVDIKKAITLDGNGKTITGLTAPLVNNSSADFVIKDLTVSGAEIEIKSANGNDNDTSSAALVQWANGGTLTFDNVSVLNSTINGDGYVAALVGFVDSTSKGVVVNGGTVKGVTMVAGGVVGAVTALTYADVTVNDVAVTEASLTSTSDGGTRTDKVGLVVGRPCGGNTSVSATVDETNKAEPVTEANKLPVFGSLISGETVITGGSYATDPTITGKGADAASPSIREDFELKQNPDGSFKVAAEREFVITADKAEVVIGETVEVTVTLNGTDLVGAEWTLVYDMTKFELISGELEGNKFAGINNTFAASEVMATYTFKALVQAPTAANAFTVANVDAWNINEANNGDTSAVTSQITPAEVVIIDPEYLVEVDADVDYVAGKKLVLVYTNSADISFAYAGAAMYDVSTKYIKDGYAYSFAIVADAIEGDYAENVAITYGTVASEYVIIYNEYNYDVNNSGEINLRDVTVVFGVYNGNDSTFANYMNIVLNADINADGVVNGIDTDAFVRFVSAYTAE